MNGNQGIPFLDLVTPHRELKKELLEVVNTALDTAGFIGGPMVQAFETDFAAFCEVEHCVGVGSGTDALRFALIAAGVGPGDIAVTVANTFIATTEAISQAGARPRFVDVDEATYNMDPLKLREYLELECEFEVKAGELVERKTGNRVAAIVPVHLYGQMANMDAILELAKRYHLVVIEDACQAHGAEYFSKSENRWRKAGSMGLAGAFSFYPGKNLGACGEAGAITTNDAELTKKMRMLRDHGQAQKYYHDMEGYNGRLDAIQAGMLRVKLTHLESWNEERRLKAAEYTRLLSDCKAIHLPYEPPWSRGVYHLYVIRTSDREGLMNHLKDAGIASALHYPVPLHLQSAYVSLNYSAGDLPVTENAAAEIVSLPMYPQLTLEQQEKVAAEVTVFSMRLLQKSADMDPVN